MATTTLDRKLQRLLRDFGYEVQGNIIVQKGITGWSSDTVWRRCRGMMDACEMLIPIIHDEKFATRYRQLTTPSRDTV